MSTTSQQPECATCKTPMRSRKESVADFPGTRRVGANGRCARCTKPERTITELQDKEQREREALAAAANLARGRKERAQREAIRQQGLQRQAAMERSLQRLRGQRQLQSTH